jgi:hypothetical protein
MEPPAVLAQNGSTFRTATPTGNCKQTLTMTAAGSNGMDLVQLQALDHILLAPKVRRFFETYLAADAVRKADFRKAAAYASHRFGFDPPVTPSLQDEVAAAVAIARKAAEIACANDFSQMIDGAGLGFVDSALLANAYATLAMSYRYVVGSYATDPTLSDLGEAAVRFVLLAEREHDPALSVSGVPADSVVPTSDGFGQNQELSSTLSIFEPPPGRRDEEIVGSLDAIFRRLKDEILLMA